MASSTATTLASNRRRLRLAQHNQSAGAKSAPSISSRKRFQRGVAGGAAAVASPGGSTTNAAASGDEDVPSPTPTANASDSTGPQDGESAESTCASGATGSSSSPGAARRRLARHAAGDAGGGYHRRVLSEGPAAAGGGKYARDRHRGNTRSSSADDDCDGGGRGGGGGVARPQHLQQRRSGGRGQKQLQPPPSHDEDVGAPSRRGRSRRSRAATRRGVGVVGPEPSPLAPVPADGHDADRAAGKLALNLRVAESVDSDDNGTCFNSVGTTTPRNSRDPEPPRKGNRPEAPRGGGRGAAAAAARRRRGHGVGSSGAGGSLGEALSPLHESRPVASRARGGGDPPGDAFGGDPPDDGGADKRSRSRSRKKVPPAPTHFGKFSSETSGTAKKHNNTNNNNKSRSNSNNSSSNNNVQGDSIWDRPEEMMSSSRVDRAMTSSGVKDTTPARRGLRGGKALDRGGAAAEGNSNYSEFDHERSYREGSAVDVTSGVDPADDPHRRELGGGGAGAGADHRGGRGDAAGNGDGGAAARAGGPVNYDPSPRRGHPGAGRPPPSTEEAGPGWFREGRSVGGDGGGNAHRGVDGGVPFHLGGPPRGAAPGGTDGNEQGDNDLLSRPNMKTAIGVGAAATLGAFMLGPVGLLVGAASVGIGMGVMQIPEEQRNNVRDHAAASIEKARDVACDLSDHVSTNCARYTGTDPREVAERVLPEEFVGCCSSGGEEGRGEGGNYRERRGGGVGGGHHQRGGLGEYDGRSLAGDEYTQSNGGGGLGGGANAFEIRSEGSSPIANAVNGVERGMNRLVGDVFGDDHPSPMSQSPLGVDARGGGGGANVGNAGGDHGIVSEKEDAGRRVACGRKGRVVPLRQIHSLRPSLQPRAWLDVMASAHTTRDDKNEAMQEILILAKDKEISRWFLEEGILDSLMFILSNYFRNYSSFLRNETPSFANETAEPFKSFKQGGQAFYHARLAANSCVALGKAHCAAVHTEGDLLLMSAYSRGSVPVERQLAQMLFEVPHHMKVMNPAHGAGGRDANGPNSDMSGGGPPQQQQFEAEFTLTELSMQQAEDLARSIKALDDGNIDV